MTPEEACIFIKHNVKLIGKLSDKSIIRIFGTTIFDIPEKFSGKVSTKLVKQYGPYTFLVGKVCKDHRLGRNRAGRLILKKYREGLLTDKCIHSIINEACIVNWVTQKENNVLTKHQQNVNETWEDSYRHAGIILVDCPKKAPAWFFKIYQIEDKIYENMYLATLGTGLNDKEILKRCLALSKKWQNWKRLRPC